MTYDEAASRIAQAMQVMGASERAALLREAKRLRCLSRPAPLPSEQERPDHQD